MNKKEISMNSRTLEIDYTDWYDDVMRAEETIQCKDDIFTMINNGKRTSDIAKSAIVSREVGLLETEDAIKPNKMLLLSGAMANVASIVKRSKYSVVTENGKKYYVPEYIGRSGRRDNKKQDDAYPDNYQQSVSDEGLRLAERYLTRVIPGHIFNHLLIVHENGGDVQKIAEILKDNIDMMIDRLE